MRLTSRLLVGLTTALAAVAIAAPAHAAERPRPTTTQTSIVTPPEAQLAPGVNLQLERQLDAASLQLARRGVHCNWMRCWWTQWVGPGHYVVAKYTWSGTWYLKRKTDSADTGFEATQILCSFASPWCGAFTWALWRYWKYMLNRAISHRRCLVVFSKTFGFGAPVYLRTARCSR